jgi:prepilin peptidase CpaA
MSVALPPLMVASTMVFVALLIVAAASDFRSRRVPNVVSILLLVTGLGVSIGRLGVAEGSMVGMTGVLTGLALWLPAYAARLIGAGDVKMFAGGAAWLGWSGALLAAVITAVAGGVLGLVWLFRRRGKESVGLSLAMAISSPRLLQLQPFDRRERVPYALAVAVGLLGTWVYEFAKIAGGK